MMLFTIVALGLCVGAFGDAPAAHYEVANEVSITGTLPRAKLLAARGHRAERESPPVTRENITVQDDHDYYTSTFKQGDTTGYWFDLLLLYANNDSHVVLSPLSADSRTVRFQSLPFPFPYYGHILSFIGVGTNGFLNAGTLLHNRVDDFQYIAPLQANFEPSNGNGSGIYIYSSDDRFTVQWDKVINIDHTDAGVFTFQVSLFPSGDIHFAYREIPVDVMNISDESHPVRVGLSDAFFQALASIDGYVYGIIQTYHAVDLSVRNVLSHSAIVLSPLPNCIKAQSCEECSNVVLNSDFNCGWCQSLNRCSDGIDRHRQEWLQTGCHQEADLSYCAEPTTEVPIPPTTATMPATATMPVRSQIVAQASGWQQAGSIVGILIGILVIVAVVALISVCVGVAIYGYRHPASRVGLYMIEARKGRFRTNRIDTYDVKKEQLTAEE